LFVLVFVCDHKALRIIHKFVILSNYMVLFLGRLVSQNKSMATMNSRIAKPSSVELTWCLAGCVVAVVVAVVAGWVPVKLTVDSGVWRSVMLLEPPFNRADVVPGWTRLDCVLPLGDCTLDCGLWVVVWDCDVPVIGS
jgi:hypothetical protein